MKKLLWTLTVFTIILSVFSTAVFAYDENTEAHTEDGGESISAENETTFEDEDTTPAYTSFFQEAFDLIKANASEILSALACIFSAVLLIFYKKGVLPLIKGGLSSLCGGVKALGDEAANQSACSENASKALLDSISSGEELLTKIGDSVDAFDKKLMKIEREGVGSKTFITILTAQIDMLYEVFMAAAMPQYEKERIGESISSMKKKLSTLGDENEE